MIISFARSELKAQLRRRILAQSGFLARRVWYRNPLRGPLHQAALDVARDAGIGDVLMCTPALRALKRHNPGLHIRFFTNFPELVAGLPYIDEVRRFAERPPQAIFVEYTDIVPSPAHIARLIGDRLGVDVRDVRPDCVIDPERLAHWRAAWRDLPRPHVVVVRRASRFTPNKDWPNASWTDLVARLSRSGTVIEVGLRDDAAVEAPVGSYLDLRDRTPLADLVAVLAAADLYVGPVSGPMHIAAATGTRAVVVIGGYEHPANAHYDGNVEFYTPVPCAPCWLRAPCPYGLKCLRAISPAQVEDAIAAQWRAIQAGAR